MKKCMNRGMALLIAAAMSMSCIPVYAVEEKVVETETTTEGDLTTNTTTTTTTNTDEDGNVTVVVQIDKTTTNEDGELVAEAGSEKGKETSTEVNTPNGKVDIPLNKEDGKNSIKGDEVGTSSVTGDEKDGDDDQEYDYTTSTVVNQGSVTVSTNDVVISESIDTENTDMNYVYSQATPDADNDLFLYPEKYAPIYPTGPDDMPEVTDGHQYIFLGQENNSQFFAAFLYTTPGSEGEIPAYTAPDGTNYYTHKGAGGPLGGNYRVQGYYKDGELVSNEPVGTVWTNISQWVMIDSATGERITTYCADIDTFTQDYYSYNMENVEDGTYYSEDQAAMIRTVAKLGYWGTVDDPETPEAEYGSLQSMKDMMRTAKDENGKDLFTEEEINSLTDGMAMTATQYAIWNFSNHMSGVEFLNAHWINKNADNVGGPGSWSSIKDIPANKRDSLDLIFKIYDYLITSAPTELEGTTSDTIINSENFLSDTSITILGKDGSHVNNNDDDDTNDAYVTNLTFALVVKPSEENGDELVVTVVASDGSILAAGRIAGEVKDGETLLTPDANGNYCFEGLTLIEGKHNIKLNLSGIQNLTEGVYLYTSEVRTDDTGADVQSQTMVGVASGERAVDVSMDLAFELNVEDEIIVTERYWSSEWYEEYEEETGDENDVKETESETETEEETETVPGNENWTPNDPGDGTVEIEDEDVPMADAPATGDIAVMLLAAAAVSGAGFLAVASKKREDEE